VPTPIVLDNQHAKTRQGLDRADHSPLGHTRGLGQPRDTDPAGPPAAEMVYLLQH